MLKIWSNFRVNKVAPSTGYNLISLSAFERTLRIIFFFVRCLTWKAYGEWHQSKKKLVTLWTKYTFLHRKALNSEALSSQLSLKRYENQTCSHVSAFKLCHDRASVLFIKLQFDLLERRRERVCGLFIMPIDMMTLNKWCSSWCRNAEPKVKTWWKQRKKNKMNLFSRRVEREEKNPVTCR